MRTILSAAFLAAIVSTGMADDPKKPDDKAEKKEPTFIEKLTEIRREMTKERNAILKERLAAKTDEEKEKLDEKSRKVVSGFALKMLDLAKSAPKDPGAYSTAKMAMLDGDDVVAAAAADFIVEKFGDDKRLVADVPSLIGSEAGQKMLAKLAAKSTDKVLKAAILFAVAEAEIQNADYPRTGKPYSPKETAERMADGAKKLEAVVAEFGDVELPAAGRAKAATVAEKAKKLDFFVKNLTIGKAAPDMECELLEDGKKAKLSDYRGKVVVVDFWATWCPPCRAMIPHERVLTEKLKSEKFAFISVSGDDKKETLTKFLEKEPMPWTHFWAGHGKAVTDYQIRFWPTIYVLDAKGVIRFKHVREKKMDEAVESLLKEMNGAQ